MNLDVYQRLAEHLDRLPDGFAPSETGAELRLLQRLFTPEEAELATYLTLDREEIQTIAARAGLPFAEAQQRLDEMARKGLIFATYPPEGLPLYSAVPWVVGIWEFQVNRMSDEFMRDADEYWRTQKRVARAESIGQMRTIPVGESITPQLAVLPHEHVNALIAAQDRFAVAPCICRRGARLHGKGCAAPEESCLMFGDFADYYVHTGRGRAIDRVEVQAILTRANEANLVLQPTNSQDIAAICCCCGCCCGILHGIQRAAKPAEVVINAFIAQFDPEACQGCFTCLQRCQMGALTEDGDRVALNADRCIGCGLCVSTCPSSALTLVRKGDSPRYNVPGTMNETYHIIAREQADQV